MLVKHGQKSRVQKDKYTKFFVERRNSLQNVRFHLFTKQNRQGSERSEGSYLEFESATLIPKAISTTPMNFSAKF